MKKHEIETNLLLWQQPSSPIHCPSLSTLDASFSTTSKHWIQRFQNPFTNPLYHHFTILDFHPRFTGVVPHTFPTRANSASWCPPAWAIQTLSGLWIHRCQGQPSPGAASWSHWKKPRGSGNSSVTRKRILWDHEWCVLWFWIVFCFVLLFLKNNYLFRIHLILFHTICGHSKVLYTDRGLQTRDQKLKCLATFLRCIKADSLRFSHHPDPISIIYIIYSIIFDVNMMLSLLSHKSRICDNSMIIWNIEKSKSTNNDGHKSMMTRTGSV